MRWQGSAANSKPEIEILVCCARKTLDVIQLARLKQIIENRIDWRPLFDLATENGLLPLVCQHLVQNASLLPSEAAEHFRDANRHSVVQRLFLTAELLRIDESLSRRQVPTLFYKGPVLGQLAYANPLLREFDDLDVVVPQRFMPHVYEEMALLGYEARFSRDHFITAGEREIPGEYVFFHSVNRAMVEFHTEFTMRHFPRPPNLDNMELRSAAVLLNGRQVPTFALADTLLMLCVHGAKDFWVRLIWVADVAALASSLSDDDWERLVVESKKYDAERMVRLGLWLATAIFQPELPAAVLQDIERDRVVARIGRELCDQLLNRKPLPQSLAWRSLYRIRMVPQIWKGIRYWIRLSTAPAEEDWSMTQNRRGSRASYAFLRPLRLWQKYGHSPESKEPMPKH